MGKPRLKLVDDAPVEVMSAAVAEAKRKHGKPFAHEKGSTFKPHEVPVLTRWMQAGGANRERK